MDIKRIFKTKYNFEFLIKPIIILSLSSLFFYLLKILSVKFIDEIFCAISLTFLSFIIFKKIKNKNHKYIFLTFILTFLLVFVLFYNDINLFLAKICNKNSISFSFFDFFYNTLGLNGLENLIYKTSYGGMIFLNENIVSGAVNIFKANCFYWDNLMFLSGKIISNFALCGLTLAIEKNKTSNLIIVIITLITGNNFLLLLNLFINYMPYYFYALFYNSLSFFIVKIFSIKCGFYFNPSIIELVLFNKNVIYFLCFGVLVLAISYYFTRLANEKLKCYSFSNRRSKNGCNK